MFVEDFLQLAHLAVKVSILPQTKEWPDSWIS